MMAKTILVIVGIAIISFIGACIYFAAGVSYTYPPIKRYHFSGNITRLLSGIKEYTVINRNVSLNITDTTGNKKNGYKIYMDIAIQGINGDLVYSLNCEKINSNGKPADTRIQLIGVFNKKNYHIGGYSVKGIGVKEMVNNFDTGFLTGLRKKQNISIQPY